VILVPLLLALGAAPEPTASQVEGWLSSLRGDLPPNPGKGLKARTAAIPKAKGDVRDVYAKAAPGTVLIRTPHGFGSGIVISAKGYILTNHHVIAPAMTVDFKQQVTVELGKLDEDGLMEKDGSPRIAWVLKSDPLIDLAVIKLDDPPKDLKAVKVAEKDPLPGEAVSAIGNGGIGLLWAIKDGEISSIGKLATHLALLVGSECQVSTDPAVADACKKSRATLEVERKAIAERVPGLVIQSSCTISPGDSGGPLVNRAGELVGVNAFLRSDSSAPVTANFHVHVKEVRKFLAEVPAEPQARIGQPWDSLSGVSSLLDVDGDGITDTLFVKSLPVPAAFIDLDQDSRLPATSWPDSVFIRRSLKAEVAVRKLGDKLAAFYDTNGDGRFDRVHLQGPGGKPEAYELSAEGAMKKLDVSAPLIDPGQVKGEAAKARLAKATASVLSQITGEAGDLPDPLLAAGALGNLFDGDKNGKFDVFEIHSLYALVTLLDLGEGELAGLNNAKGAKLLGAKGMHPRVSFVERGEELWAFYDTDGDHKLDLVLLSSDTASGAVTRAFNLTAEGKMDKERPELIGTMFGRPLPVFGFTPAEAARYVAIQKALKVPWEASGKSASASPHPVFDVGSDVLSESPEKMPGFTNQVISVEGTGLTRGSSLLFDLDVDGQKGKAIPAIEKAAGQGTFGAELAWVMRGRHEWYLYDTNHDGKLDLMLFRADGVTHATRFDDKGKSTAAPELDKGPLVRPELFADPKLKAAVTALAPLYFTGETLTP
jgi:S1-C subfamily serine protease